MYVCPRCEREMKSVNAGVLDVQACPACRGLWLDGDGFHRALRMSEADLAAVTGYAGPPAPLSLVLDHPPAFCPRCSQPLNPQRFDLGLAVIIDICPLGHGIWLDEGELEAAAAFHKRNQSHLACEERLLPWSEAHREEVEAEKVRENLARGERDLLVADVLMKVVGTAAAAGLIALDAYTGSGPAGLSVLREMFRGRGRAR